MIYIDVMYTYMISDSSLMPGNSIYSIFSAEANVIYIALKLVASSDKSKFIIGWYSLSCLLTIGYYKTQNPFA